VIMAPKKRLISPPSGLALPAQPLPGTCAVGSCGFAMGPIEWDPEKEVFRSRCTMPTDGRVSHHEFWSPGGAVAWAKTSKPPTVAAVARAKQEMQASAPHVLQAPGTGPAADGVGDCPGTGLRPANAGVEDCSGSAGTDQRPANAGVEDGPGRAGTNLCPGVAGSGSAGTDLRPASAGSGKLLSYVRKMREESDDQVFQARDPQLFFSIGVTALQRNPGRGCRRSSALRRPPT